MTKTYQQVKVFLLLLLGGVFLFCLSCESNNSSQDDDSYATDNTIEEGGNSKASDAQDITIDGDDDTETSESQNDTSDEPGSTDNPNDSQECLTNSCMDQIVDCMEDEECSAWMDCIRGCESDDMKCQTICVMFHQSDLADDITVCMTESECIDLDYPNIPDCPPAQDDLSDLSGLDGTWWMTAYTSEPHIFDVECQRFDFTKRSSSLVEVSFTTPLTVNGQERMCATEGTFELLEDGSVKVAYNSFVEYYELWRIIHKSENTLFAHLCFTAGPHMKDYGSLVLSRVPLAELDYAEYEALDEAVAKTTGVGVEGLLANANESCTNQ